MIKHFLNLEWKQYFRSSYWQKNILLNILLVFFALLMIISFLSIGLGAYAIIKHTFPDSDPFIVFNGFIFFWLLGDLFIRFFFQKLPVMSVKPLLTLPIKRSKIVNYVLGKSATNFFNFLPLFTVIPFGVILIKEGHSPSTILVWMLAVFILVLINNYLNFIIESISSEIELSFLPIIATVGGLFALNHFNIINFSELISGGILAITASPLYLIAPLIVLFILYYFNFKILLKKLFLDSSLKVKAAQAKSTNLQWTNMFGSVAPFMQLDIKLITRNKRTKSSLWMLGLGLLYGMFFYPNPIYQDKESLFAFVGVFVTGIFLINFGQFIPAWDSGYYKMLMSQNIPYKDYLRSKHTLMTLSVIVLFVLSIPYVYFGWKILVVHFAAAVYNIGINTHVILLGGAFNRKKIELDQKAAFNFQGTGAVQWLIGIPLMLVPMGIFALTHWLVNFEMATATLLILGFLGIIFHHKIMNAITKKYLNSKYKMIDAFSQNT